MDSFENLMKVLDILPKGEKSELKQKKNVYDWAGFFPLSCSLTLISPFSFFSKKDII